jgi:exopolyphosphatase/guanosine-5'-triphosphate,3'-diphosphate pyrophosphatase
LRLGEDVFKSNKISPKRIKRTKEIFDYLIHLFADHDVTHTKACATSAMRDADNSNALIEKIKKSSGIQIQCIGGLQEAKLIYEAVRTKMNIENSNTLLVDIGGGSTEITVAKDNKVLASKSFNIGTVRLLKEKKIEVMESIIEEHIFAIEKYLRSKMKIHKIDYAIGTGGKPSQNG